MRLDRLLISGFKSFPDRSELAFDSGVTAIVGPNGCGKSNLVDAITWVLGEQSAKSLRGERMDDLIFGGSSARRPTGAAEVRLKLKNVRPLVTAGAEEAEAAAAAARSAEGNGHGQPAGNGRPNGQGAAAVEALDGRDVELARRLYRSGESEYLIDGEICRLRDVQDLLMSSGVGVKGYAVIEQGKIGQILTSRPTDRRQLIEEAAGVTKYKSRRRAAELKLEAAQQNLVRVDDIVFELEKQRAALKRQAKKAHRYRRLREELRRWEKVSYARRYRGLREVLQRSESRLQEARARERDAAARLAGVEAAIDRLRTEMSAAEAEALASREAVHAAELDVERRQQQIGFDRQQIETLTGAAEAMTGELAALEARLEPELSALAARRNAAEQADRERDEAAAVLRQGEDEYASGHRDLEGLEADVEAARSEVYAAMTAATALRHVLENAAVNRSRLSEEIAKLDLEAAELTRERERLGAEEAQAASALDEARRAMAVLVAEQDASEAERARQRDERTRLGQELRAAEHRLAASSARLRSLEELAADRSGYGDAARAILASGGTVRHFGSVADYLEVDRQHERAIEALLGPLLEYVIVPDLDQAHAGLAFVEERQAGRCGFLVLGVPPHRPAPADATPASGSSASRMSHVLRVHGPYADAIRAAVGDAVLVDSLEAAPAAAGETPWLAAVTPDGHVWRGPCLVEGGTRAESKGILAVNREIKELRERLAGEQARVDSAADEVRRLDASLDDLNRRIEEQKAERHGREKIIVAHELQLHRLGEDLQRTSRKLEVVGLERRRSGESRDALEQRQIEARDSIARIEVDQAAAEDRLQAAQQRLTAARDRLEGLSRRVAEAKASHAALVERSAALAAEVEREAAAHRELEARIAADRDGLRRTERRIDGLRESVRQAETALLELQAALEQARERLRAADARVIELQATFHAQDGAARESRGELETIRAEIGRIDVERATAEADLANLATLCLETVQADLEDVAAEVQRLEEAGLVAALDTEAAAESDVEDQEEGMSAPDDAAGDQAGPAAAPAAERGVAAPVTGRAAAEGSSPEELIAELRTKIDRLGPVNMMAIEQFDELETRHAFLTTQRQDLVDSIASTQEAIRRIDRTTKERFREAFEAINGNFQATFQTLFGGGQAGLVLLDEADLLESGIDIVAQPPGKRLQNVQLLSGGEKALTAMALMFGIFKYRPSPFCLLDEIDAPLDDANIGRFIEMLRSMEEHTQFILITHNRKTMEIADRLYGVTMEEPGVSKLVSVSLN